MNVFREIELTGTGGTPLYVRECIPATPLRGGVVLMHGLGEHSGRYIHLAKFFNQHGWAVRGYDHRGHGRSGGPRGDTVANDTLCADARLVVEDFAEQMGSAPLLFGHSMGGLFAAQLAVSGRVPLRGLLLSSPALSLPLTGVQKMLLAVLSRIAPGMAVANGVDSSLLSHDPAVGRAYDSDPLVHRLISARLLRAMLAAIDEVQAGAASLAIPTLLQVAGDDRLVDASGSKRFFASLPPGQAQMHWYDGLYHEIFNERDAGRVYADLLDGMVQHGWASAPHAA